MQEAKGYVDILLESLNKKIAVLDAILQQNELQAVTAGAEKFDMDGFEQIVDTKEQLIQEIIRLDNGFESVYDRVSKELKENRSRYTEQIKAMQQLIGRIADKSVAIQTSEARNKKLVEAAFQKTRLGFQQGRSSVKAASDYYKSMSRVNYIDPQMLDTKK